LTRFQKQNGPASAATDPDHGSTILPKGKAMNAAAHTTSAPIPAMSNVLGDVDLMAIGQAIGMARAEQELAQDIASRAKTGNKPGLQSEAERRRDGLDDAYQVLRDMLTLTKASSLEGAALQIAEAFARLDLVLDRIPNEILSADWHIRVDVRAINRLLFSALEFIDGAAARKIDEVADPYFANWHMNPWTAPRVEGSAA